MNAIRFASEKFLKTENWEDDLHEVLAKLGQATGVSQVYVLAYCLQTTGQNDGPPQLIRRINIWNSTPEVVTFHNEEQSEQATGRLIEMARLIDLLAQGEIVVGNTEDFEPQEQVILNQHHVLSIIIVPIFVQGSLWGTIGLNDKEHTRSWSLQEIDAPADGRQPDQHDDRASADRARAAQA